MGIEGEDVDTVNGGGSTGIDDNDVGNDKEEEDDRCNVGAKLDC